MARIGEDRRIHRIEPAPAVPDTPEPLTRPAPDTEPGTPAVEPAPPSTVPAPSTAP
jgi:hypothetical protein